MEGKAVLFCVLFLIETALSQCYFPQATIADTLGIYDPRLSGPIAAIPPLGLSLPSPSFFVESDGLLINGAVSVAGNLPFTSAVVVEGVVPTAGLGSVLYNTGAGKVEIIREIPYEVPFAAYQRPGIYGLY